MRKKIVKALAVGLASGLTLSLLLYTGIFETLDLKLLDHRFSAARTSHIPSSDIVIVTIDQNSIDYLKKRMGILWKWPRDVYANVVEFLKNSGAKAVYLDFDMSDPDITRAGYDEGETDRGLGEAIKRADNVVMPFVLYEKLSSVEGDDVSGYEALKRFSVNITGDSGMTIEGSESAVLPVQPLISMCRGLGVANLHPDRDGIIRRIRLLHDLRGAIYASTPLSVALSLNNSRDVKIEDKYRIRLGPHTAVVNREGDTYINWYGPGGPEGKTYRYYPIADVLLSNLRQKDGLTPVINPAELSGKIVLVGSNAPSLYDLKPTPVSGRSAYPGVEITATVINNLLDGSSMSRAGNGAVAALTLAVCVITAFMVIFIKSAALNISFTIILIFTVHIVAAAQHGKNIFLPVAAADAGILLTFIAASIYNYVTVGRERIWLKKAFSHYVPAPLVSEIMQNPDKLRLGGERKDVPILFADLKGFTSMSEKMEPEQVAALLNEYFTPMTEIVFRYNGTLDKYIGDALMAFWGAPVHLDDCRADACRTAIDMVLEMERLKAKWKSDGLPDFIQDLKVRIGINSGIVSVGNMGSATRFDYTVIGDEVNLTSRLEGINKVYGTNIIVSEPVYESTKILFIYRELDLIRVVGKKHPVRIYELISKRDGDANGRLPAEIERFGQGLALYRERKWDEALRVFSGLYEERGDPPCSVFIERCRHNKEVTVPKGWDGVFKAEGK